jgi:hypothetical protein
MWSIPREPRQPRAAKEFMALVRAGQAATVSDAVQKVTGKPARTFAAWVQENAAAFV